MKVGDLFDYTLDRKPKTDLDKIKEMMSNIETQAQVIDKESKLF